ncbi:MAG: DUF1365 domain-containing protein, partial [Leptospira sp.]|nr:DUF1365 domain-containing protein [Leptospira sp.]
FYYIFENSDNGEVLNTVMAEVNNTYNEQKLYLVRDIKNPTALKKSFYISPFIQHDAEFRFELRIPGEQLYIRIDSEAEKKTILKAIVKGKHSVISDANLLFCFFRYPFYTFFVIYLIHWQALKLFFKRVPYFGKKETDQKILDLGSIK